MVLTCTRCGSENEEGTACFTCGALLAGATQIVQGTVLVVGVVYVSVNLSVDLLYGWIDPRVRLG